MHDGVPGVEEVEVVLGVVGRVVVQVAEGDPVLELGKGGGEMGVAN